MLFNNIFKYILIPKRMYSSLFSKCIPIILKNEGGYCWHESDPGGETNMGICRLFYPDLDIKNLTKEEVIKIYYEDYWKPMNLEGIKDENLVLQVFDHGVNTRNKSSGFKPAIRMLQRIVHVVDDGIIGRNTLKAINKAEFSVCDMFVKRRKIFYMNLAVKKPKLEVFLKGWLARIDKTHF